MTEPQKICFNSGLVLAGMAMGVYMVLGDEAEALPTGTWVFGSLAAGLFWCATKIKQHIEHIEKLSEDIEQVSRGLKHKNYSYLSHDQILDDLYQLEKTSFSEIIGIPYSVREFFSTARKWQWKKILINGGLLIMAVYCIFVLVALAYQQPYTTGGRIAGKILIWAFIVFVVFLFANRKSKNGKNNDQEHQ